MSAGPSPQGGPPMMKEGSKSPPTSQLRRFGPRILLAGVGVGLTYAFYATRAPPKPGTPKSNPLRTQGVKNIERAYSNGGATSTHTPAYGGTKMGDKDSTHLREGGATGLKNGTQGEHMGDEQRAKQPTKIGEAWNSMMYGNDKGK